MTELNPYSPHPVTPDDFIHTAVERLRPYRINHGHLLLPTTDLSPLTPPQKTSPPSRYPQCGLAPAGRS